MVLAVAAAITSMTTCQLGSDRRIAETLGRGYDDVVLAGCAPVLFQLYKYNIHASKLYEISIGAAPTNETA